jgi:hypothetical protein
MAGLEPWCRVTLIEANGSVAAAWLITGSGTPTLALVDWLSRLRLAADRGGVQLYLGDVCGDLEGLLELVGLSEVVKREAVTEVRTSGRSGPCRGRS